MNPSPKVKLMKQFIGKWKGKFTFDNPENDYEEKDFSYFARVQDEIQ